MMTRSVSEYSLLILVPCFKENMFNVLGRCFHRYGFWGERDHQPVFWQHWSCALGLQCLAMTMMLQVCSLLPSVWGEHGKGWDCCSIRPRGQTSFHRRPSDLKIWWRSPCCVSELFGTHEPCVSFQFLPVGIGMHILCLSFHCVLEADNLFSFSQVHRQRIMPQDRTHL